MREKCGKNADQNNSEYGHFLCSVKKFTFEIEKGNTIPFLDILIIRKPGKIETTVYRKKTCNDLYMNWYYFVPES